LADTLKIFNKTRSIVTLARTGKKEYFLRPHQSIEILANEVEEDPRLKASIQKNIHWNLIETSIVGVPLIFPRDDVTNALTKAELEDYVETEREDPTGVGTDELVKVSAADIIAEFLSDKLIAGTGITLTIVSPGGDESIRIDATGGGGTPFDCDKILLDCNYTLVTDNCGNIMCCC